jgi:2-methylcitrate dehydratase PrpD
MTTVQETALAPLCDWAASFALERAPEGAAEQVRYLLLDHVANVLGGLAADSTATMRRFVVGRGGACPAPGTLALAEEYAALYTGVSAHALETDDTHQPSSSHPGAAVFPAALAIAAGEDSDFETFAAAAVAGYEAMARIGVAATALGQYRRGFHPTGTCGVFGAAVAGSRLLGLDAVATASAVGIANSMAAGSMAFLVDGAWTKRLHPGWAAHSGVVAARLAALGYEGPRDAIAGRDGFLQAYTDTVDPHALTSGLPGAGGEAEPLAVFRTSIKAHACCRYMQAPIDAVLELVRAHEVHPDDIERIRIGVLEAGWGLIADPIEAKRRPSSVVDAQFSMPFGAAVAALHGAAGTTEFTPEVIHSVDVADMMDRVECYRSAGLDAQFPERWPAEAQLVLRDGRVLMARIDFPKGDPEQPLTWTELEDKFRALTSSTVTADGQGRVIEAVRRLGTGGGVTPRGLARLLSERAILVDGIAAP